MQMPSIVTTNIRTPGVEGVASVANRVIPVAPVNPSVSVRSGIEVTPGVVNLVNPALQQKAQPTEGEPVFTSVPDPVRKGTEAAAPKTGRFTVRPRKKLKIRLPNRWHRC